MLAAEQGPSVAQAEASSSQAASSLGTTGTGVCGPPARVLMERARRSPSHQRETLSVSGEWLQWQTLIAREGHLSQENTWLDVLIPPLFSTRTGREHQKKFSAFILCNSGMQMN